MNQNKTKTNFPGVRHGTGTLLRLNLAPIMGRRDAAYDAVAEYAAVSVAAEKAGELLDILNVAERDSADLLGLLSSPDTIEREQHIFRHIRELVQLLQVLESWRNFEVSSGSEFDGQVRNSVSARIAGELKKVVSSLELYRYYAAKSASASYAEHYKKSYSFYLDIYKSRLKAAQTVES